MKQSKKKKKRGQNTKLYKIQKASNINSESLGVIYMSYSPSNMLIPAPGKRIYQEIHTDLPDLFGKFHSKSEAGLQKGLARRFYVATHGNLDFHTVKRKFRKKMI